VSTVILEITFLNVNPQGNQGLRTVVSGEHGIISLHRDFLIFEGEESCLRLSV
jgi:hypothetical protein